MDKGKLLQSLQKLWQPKPLTLPEPNPEFDKLKGWQRIREVFRYTLLRLEYWASPKGQLREWLRLNAKLAGVIGIPILLLVPVIMILLALFQWLIISLAVICGKLVVLPATLLVALVLIILIINVFKSLLNLK